MKYIVCPDSFKGSFSALEVANAMVDAIVQKDPTAEIVRLPLSDGGEGFLEACAMARMGRVEVFPSWNADGFPLQSKALWWSDSEVVLESATSIGLPLISPEHNILSATSYGLGSDILHVIHQGAKLIHLGLGGSATNDGGVGALSAMGVEFFDPQHHSFQPNPQSLHHIEEIETSSLKSRFHDIQLRIYTDVSNPFTGPNGATKTFAPQKGASPEIVELLENQMKSWETILNQHRIDTQAIGMGAAGGTGAGLSLVFSVEMKSGIEEILDLFKFDTSLINTDIVLTGEGRLDSQSFSGKVLDGLWKRIQKSPAKLVTLCAHIQEEARNEAKIRGIQICQLFDPQEGIVKDHTRLKQAVMKSISHII